MKYEPTHAEIKELLNGQYDNFRANLQRKNATELIVMDLKGAHEARAVIEGIKGTKIIKVDFSGSNIGDEGARAIGEGLQATSVTDIKLSWCRIRDKGACDFVYGLKGSSVVNIELWGNKIGDEGARAIGTGLAGTNVLYLNLCHNDIGDIAAYDLIKAQKHTRVMTINLMNNNISYTGARLLAPLIPGTHLICIEGLENETLKEAVALNKRCLVITPYCLASLNHLPDDEKEKYCHEQHPDQVPNYHAKRAAEIRYAGGIFMRSSFGVQKEILKWLPLMDTQFKNTKNAISDACSELHQVNKYTTLAQRFHEEKKLKIR